MHKLQFPHVLNTWFLFKKCESNNLFIQDWAFFTSYKDNILNDPLVTYHHTGDQSIFNILVHKYNCFIFHHKDIRHDTNKNKNLALRVINSAQYPYNYIKYIDMTEMDGSSVKKTYERLHSIRQSILDDLQKIVIDSGDPLEGNSFYTHHTLNLYSDLYTKQLNLFWCGTQATTKICEIGFNAGHSAMLMLLGRTTPLEFTIFDIGMHRSTVPCVNYIKSKFEGTFEYIEGNSIVTMPQWIQNNPSCLYTYDVIHVDGGHSEECISNDMRNSDLLLKQNGIMIVDDTNNGTINHYVNLYIQTNRYREMDVLTTKGYPHRIIQKIN